MKAGSCGLFPDNEAAERCLVQYGILRDLRACPSCGSTGSLIRTRYCCPACGRIWGTRYGSILDGSKVSAGHFLDIVRCYADDLSVAEASRRTGIPRLTVRAFYGRIRDAVLEGSDACREGALLSGEGPQDASDPGREPVTFGISSAGGTVSVRRTCIPGGNLLNALHVPRNLWGNIIFIPSYGLRHPGYILYFADRRGSETVVIRSKVGESWPQIEGFFSFSSRYIRKHGEIPREDLPAFLQEIAFRYNHRDGDLLPAIAEKIAGCCYP